MKYTMIITVLEVYLYHHLSHSFTFEEYCSKRRGQFNSCNNTSTIIQFFFSSKPFFTYCQQMILYLEVLLHFGGELCEVLLHFITLQGVRGLLLRVLDYSLHNIFLIKLLLIFSYLVQCRRYHGRRIVKRVRVYLTR